LTLCRRIGGAEWKILPSLEEPSSLAVKRRLENAASANGRPDSVRRLRLERTSFFEASWHQSGVFSRTIMRALVLYAVFVSVSLILWSGCLGQKAPGRSSIQASTPTIVNR